MKVSKVIVGLFVGQRCGVGGPGEVFKDVHPEVHYHLLCLLPSRVEKAVCAPRGPAAHLTPVDCVCVVDETHQR